MSELQAMHDRMLELRPDEAEHDESSCPFCVAKAISTATPHTEPGGPMGEFTQEDVDAAVAAAIADATSSMNQRIAELEAAAMETEVGKAVAEAVTAKDTEISDLLAKLDAAEVAKTAAENKVAELEAAEAKRVEDELTAARRDERIAKAKEIGVLDDEYIDGNADRFAAMSDDEWTNRVDEWTAIAARAGDQKAPPPPTATALEATRTNDSGDTGSALSLIGNLRRGRVPTAI